MRMLLLKTWRDILARKGQFLALMLLVAIGIMSYVGFITSYLDLKASLDKANAELRFADFNTTVLAAPETATRRLEGLPGIAAALACFAERGFAARPGGAGNGGHFLDETRNEARTAPFAKTATR